LTNNFSDKVFALENLFWISLTYPCLKIFHEFAHAYMVKKWGGEVHEMGIMLLVFMPIPYVDASSSLAFRDKYQRILVAAAGIMIELFIAAVALLIWLNVEPGPLRATAFNVMLIAGVSTLLFNGNPLLRFDAYYVLADLLEIPNLGQRSTAYLGYLGKRYLLGVGQLSSPADTVSEASWLTGYALASVVYRVAISVRIILFISGKFFFFGLLLAAWAAIGMVVMPVVRLIRFLLKDAYMKRKRLRIFLTILLPVALFVAALVVVPLPLFTTCEGVTWAPDESRVHASVDGFISEVLVHSGTKVEAGTPLLRCSDPQLDAQVRLLAARQEEFRTRYNQSFSTDRTQMALLREALSQIGAELSRAQERQRALTIYSQSAGVLVLPVENDMLGRFVHRGTALGYVIDPSKINVRVLVPQEDIEQVRADTLEVDVRLAENIQQVVTATLLREVPAASNELPSMALSLEGGGLFALDPREKQRPVVVERLFQFDIKLSDVLTDKIEERVYVRFHHSAEPLVWRWWRTLRRLLLSRFAI